MSRQQLEALMSEAGVSERAKQEAEAQLARQRADFERLAAAAAAEAAEKARIEARLAQVQERVLHGGENLVEKMSALKRLAKATRAKLEVQRCVAASQLYLGLRPREQEKPNAHSGLALPRPR
jgi:hypothetical protein